MGGLVHSLGVECEYCHVKDDYPAMTHRKQVANWMAQELIPSIRAKTGKAVWCADCHRTGERGTPNPVGKPRKQAQAVEWMNLKLAARFETKAGEPLFCRGCHGGNLGTPEFKSKLILTDLMGDGTYPQVKASVPGAPAPAAIPDTADAGALPGDAGVSEMGDGE